MPMHWRWGAVVVAVAWWALAQQDPAPPPANPEEDPPIFKTQAELERKGKKIVVVKNGPDEPPAIIELRDLFGGALKAVSAEAKTFELGDKTFGVDAQTQIFKGEQSLKLSDLKPGTVVRVEAAEQNDGGWKAFEVRVDAKLEGKSLSRSLFADPPPHRVQITFGQDAKAFGAIARVEQIRDYNDFVFMTGGTARYVEAEDRLEINLKPEPKSVEVQQGKSTAFGSRLDYDNESGEAKVAGPIELQRKGDKPLSGAASRMIYNVDDEVLRLFGGVKLEQDGRTTSAETALVREKDRLAFLYGTPENPVKSVNKDGTIEGTKLQYNLDSGDVVVLEGVKGEFTDP